MEQPCPELISSWKWKRFNDAHEVDRVNRAISRALTLFENRAPRVFTRQNRKGEEYKEIESCGYTAIRDAQMWREYNARIYWIAKSPEQREAYLAACRKADEEPRLQVYRVDLDLQTCSCTAFAESNRKFCKHLIGLAHWLTQPHFHTRGGLVVWCDQLQEEPHGN